MKSIKMAVADDRQMMRIEVVLAMPEKQAIVVLELAAGATIADAISQSGIIAMFGGFELDPAKVGLFGQLAPMEQTLRDGDRVEIYRSLVADPKEIRRQRALDQNR